MIRREIGYSSQRYAAFETLLDDLEEATAWALGEVDLLTLQAGTSDALGNLALKLMGSPYIGSGIAPNMLATQQSSRML